jgi:uncharacterized phage protein (TIGR02218 family)
MKLADSAFITHLGLDTTALAAIWKITRKDGMIIGFTDHDADIVYNSITYHASDPITRTANRGQSDLSVPDMSVDGLIGYGTVDRDDVEAHKYDAADVEVRLLNWKSPSDGGVVLLTGILGTISLKQSGYTAELRGLQWRYQQDVLESYKPTCRADLGDTRCTVDTVALQVSGALISATDHFLTVSGLSEITGYWDGGLLLWTSGPNNGLSIEVKTWDLAANQITLPLLPFSTPTGGDTFTIIPGCDKKLGTCITKFNNVVNFRGEAYMPGRDSLYYYPDPKIPTTSGG